MRGNWPCICACMAMNMNIRSKSYIVMQKQSTSPRKKVKGSHSGAKPFWREEREKLYIFSSHLGLIRCLTPVRVSAIIYFQAFLDKHRNTTNIILPHKLNHGSRMQESGAGSLLPIFECHVGQTRGFPLAHPCPDTAHPKPCRGAPYRPALPLLQGGWYTSPHIKYQEQYQCWRVVWESGRLSARERSTVGGRHGRASGHKAVPASR